MNAGLQPIASASAAMMDIVQDANTLCERVLNGQPGERIPYWIGLLARDRDTLASSLPPARRAELHITADAAMRLAEASWVHLVQQRVAPDCCAYITVVRQRPHSVAPLRITRRRLPQRNRALATLIGGAAA